MSKDNLVYQAEKAVDICGYSSQFVNEDAAFEFLEYILNSEWFYSRFPKIAKIGVIVKETKHSYAWSLNDERPYVIYLPRWSLTDFGIIHELAHICFPYAYGDDTHPSEWREIEVELVTRFIGKEAGRCLKYSMRAYGLEI